MEAMAAREVVQEETASALLFLRRVSGLQVLRMTDSDLSLLMVQWVKLSMRWEPQSQRVWEVRCEQHSAPRLKDTSAACSSAWCMTSRASCSWQGA